MARLRYVADDFPNKLVTMRKDERISKLFDSTSPTGTGLKCSCTVAAIMDSSWVPSRHQVSKALDEQLLSYVTEGKKRIITEPLAEIFAVCHLRFVHDIKKQSSKAFMDDINTDYEKGRANKEVTHTTPAGLFEEEISDEVPKSASAAFELFVEELIDKVLDRRDAKYRATSNR